MFRVVNTTEKEGRVVVDWRWGWGEWEELFNEYKVSDLQDEKSSINR